MIITKYIGCYRSVVREYERFSHSYRLKFNNKEHEIIGIYTVMLNDLYEKVDFSIFKIMEYKTIYILYIYLIR